MVLIPSLPYLLDFFENPGHQVVHLYHSIPIRGKSYNSAPLYCHNITEYFLKYNYNPSVYHLLRSLQLIPCATSGIIISVDFKDVCVGIIIIPWEKPVIFGDVMGTYHGIDNYTSPYPLSPPSYNKIV